MMEAYFKTKQFGELYIDRVLFEIDAPILFTCVNQNNDIFLCVLCQNNSSGQRWIVTKTDARNIIALLKDEKTMLDSFIDANNEGILLSAVKSQWNENYYGCDWKSVEKYLPDRGVFIDADEGEYTEDIDYFYSMLVSEDNRKDSYVVLKNSIDYVLEKKYDLFIDDSIKNNNVLIHKTVCLTLKKIKINFKGMHNNIDYSEDYYNIMDNYDTVFAEGLQISTANEKTVSYAA